MHGFIVASEQLTQQAIEHIRHQYGTNGKSPRPYHSVEHTILTVDSAKLLSEALHLPQRDSLLLAIAAAFHDFVHNGDSDPNNELHSADEAENMMRLHSVFTETDIKHVRRMILATNCTSKYPKIIQSPAENDICSKILCDADLSSFGKPFDEFMRSSDCYFKEVYPESSKNSDQYINYLKAEIVILRTHEFWTAEASSMYPHITENIQKLLALVK